MADAICPSRPNSRGLADPPPSPLKFIVNTGATHLPPLTIRGALAFSHVEIACHVASCGDRPRGGRAVRRQRSRLDVGAEAGNRSPRVPGLQGQAGADAGQG